MKKLKQKETPLRIKIFSIYILILFFINSFGIISLSFSDVIFTIISIFALLVIISTVYMLWKGYPTARKIILILSYLGVINIIFNLINYYSLKQLVDLILIIPIILYLGFNKKIKEFFYIKNK